jgi:hypothetical protein
MSIENDEGQSGTIFSANSGTSSANSCTSNQTYYKSITNDISTRKTSKGVEIGGTIDDISIRETIEGAKPRS